MRLGREWSENEERRSRHQNCGRHTAGEWATCCGNINPDTVFGFWGVTPHLPNAMFSHHPKNVFYIDTFCRIKQRVWVRWFFSVSVWMTQIVWETISFAKHHSLPIPWILLTLWEKIHMAAHGLLRSFHRRAVVPDYQPGSVTLYWYNCSNLFNISERQFIKVYSEGNHTYLICSP